MRRLSFESKLKLWRAYDKDMPLRQRHLRKPDRLDLIG
jgi:hypothetical protein